MSLNGKRDDFTLSGLQQVADTVSIKRGRARAILGEFTEAVRSWPEFAARARVGDRDSSRIAATHRLALGL